MRPPWTTWHAKFKDPVRDCNWRIEAEGLSEKVLTRSISRLNLSSGSRGDIVEESSSMPKKVTRWVRETTLRQLVLNPR